MPERLLAATRAAATAPAGRPPAVPPGTWRTKGAFGWIALSALAIAVLAPLPYLTSSLPELARSGGGLAASYAGRPVGVRVAFYLHIGFGGIALLLSPLQFLARLRARVPRLHRVTGRVVLGSIMIAGSAGLVLAPGSQAGPLGTAGFGTLALLWITFAGAAVRAVRRRDLASHRRWAVRTFALTYAAVTLRLWLVVLTPLLAATGLDPEVAWHRAYLVVPFLCWVPNLIVAEFHLARGSGPPRRRLM